MTEQLVREEAPTLFGGTAAVFNEARTHRYLLLRRWAPDGEPLVMVMLNPSTATATTDDPTITRCMKLARREGCAALAVVNLFGVRATDPADMRRHPDPVGERNGEFIAACCLPGRLVVAAWGAHGGHLGRAAEVTRMLTASGVSLVCLGVTANGEPKHPLARGRSRIAPDQPLVPYTRLEALAG